jgi:hypothetical protein
MKAKISETSERSKHSLAELRPSGPEAMMAFPAAASLEIVQEVHGYLLIRYDSGGQYCGDTWHQTVEEAKAQAMFEFSVLSDQWNESRPKECL